MKSNRQKLLSWRCVSSNGSSGSSLVHSFLSSPLFLPINCEQAGCYPLPAAFGRCGSSSEFSRQFLPSGDASCTWGLLLGWNLSLSKGISYCCFTCAPFLCARVFFVHHPALLIWFQALLEETGEGTSGSLNPCKDRDEPCQVLPAHPLLPVSICGVCELQPPGSQPGSLIAVTACCPTSSFPSLFLFLSPHEQSFSPVPTQMPLLVSCSPGAPPAVGTSPCPQAAPLDFTGMGAALQLPLTGRNVGSRAHS